MSETPTQPPITREVILSIPRKYDIDIHVSKVEIDGLVYADVREFVKSLKQYGRGIVLPKASLYAVIEALEKLDADDE